MTLLAADTPTNLWIGAQSRPALSGKTFEVHNPATQEVLAEVADAAAPDALLALDAAVAAQQRWAQVPPREKSRLLSEVFQGIEERSEDFARTMTLEMGKPLAESRGEVAYGNEYFRWFAEEAVRWPGRFQHAPSGSGSILVTRASVGPVLAITPWNFPLAMATRKIAPALAAGCPIILKPAKETPLTMLLLGQVLSEVLPEDCSGLVSILPTTDSSGVASALMADKRLRKITFTGSTGVGKHLVKQSAENLLRTSMELGGNAAFVVAEDADMDMAIDAAMQAKMRNGGEACIAANRFLVHEEIAEEFSRRLSTRMAAIRCGNGLEKGVGLGPMISREQRDKVAELVQEAVAEGATLTTGGEIPDRPGWFYPATVLVNIPEGARILREEIFGPVATVSTFATLEEGVAKANDTDFGLAAYGFSRSLEGARYLAENLRAGMVGINRGAISDPAAPFGGIKESGFGREGGTEGIEEYLDTRYIAL
ncbi:NAD-dependent succinate-semialdehyde dehydrogenase [Corynebacterium sp. 22KM0430]|nr:MULTISPECIES: NAD-dependent succinate-semialdehyde dehydrogenase [unclassified Corynebacterium]WPF66166.1 NAD-dependent succinate-semialdehyde dehydrogenase [Corynebacterium sp. 22KM0430]WPF68658.1 NAD-dependent succinate-semialdehyde dehydrogenase [Corynebacterium sp. 21KM1197]